MGGDRDDTKVDRGWEHFRKVVNLELDDVKAIEAVSGPIDLYSLSLFSEEELESVVAKANIKISIKLMLQGAHVWLLHHQDQIMGEDGDNDEVHEWDWFIANFDQHFVKFVKRRKRAASKAAKEEETKKEAKRFKNTEQNQASASVFAGSGSRTMEGVGTLPPAFYQHLVPSQVKELFSSEFDRSFEELSEHEKQLFSQISRELCGHGTSFTLKSVPETDFSIPGTQSVQTTHLDFVAKTINGSLTTEQIFHDKLNRKSKRSLSDLGLKAGVATASSYPDGYFHTKPIDKIYRGIKFIVTSIIQAKGSTADVAEGHGEAISNATAAAVEMVRIGVPVSRVVVPFLTTTGSHIQAGAVYMLEPCFPVACFVTRTLSLIDSDDDCAMAAKIFIAMERHAVKLESFIADGITNATIFPRPDIIMKLDNEAYHTKLFKDFFCCEPSVGSSILQYLRKTSKLAGAPYACLPIAIRLKDKCCDDCILFPKLSDYTIGLPLDSKDRRDLVTEIEKSVGDMHNRGVIHMDLYLSNIMWKKTDVGNFSVRLIDFDAAHLLGETLTDATVTAMRKSRVSELTMLGVLCATKAHDIIYLDVLKENIDDPLLQIGGENESNEDVKKRLDSACFNLVRTHFDSS